jgi:hypothetical protein
VGAEAGAPRPNPAQRSGSWRAGGGADIELYRVEPSRFPAEPFTVSSDLPAHAEHPRAFSVADLAGTPLWLFDRPLWFDTLPRVVDRLIATCPSS